MSKYSTQVGISAPRAMKRTVHPIWRGIGLLMMILVPILSYVAVLVLLEENARKHWFPIPADLIVRWSDPLILVKIFATIVIVVVLYAIFLLITFVLNSLFGAPRYSPLDEPPSRR